MGCYGGKSKLYAPTSSIRLCDVVKIKNTNIQNDYIIGQNIGKGRSGVVYECQKINNDNTYAVKIINVRDSNNYNKEVMLDEISILLESDHPNILKIYDVYIDNENMSIVTEICRGGELFEKISKEKVIKENQAIIYMRQIISAVSYLHKQSIVHRDLKLENIMFHDESSNSKLKLIDFGVSKHLNKNMLLLETVGSLHYIAPEVLSEKHNEKCDV